MLWQISVTLLQSPFSLRGVCPLKIWGALSWRCPILASICTLRLRRGIVGETVAVGKMSGNSFNICFFQPFVSAKTCVIWELSEHKRSDKQRLYFGEECMSWQPGRFAEMLFFSLCSLRQNRNPREDSQAKKKCRRSQSSPSSCCYWSLLVDAKCIQRTIYKSLMTVVPYHRFTRGKGRWTSYFSSVFRHFWLFNL